MMITYQDLRNNPSPQYLRTILEWWQGTRMYLDACDADEYDRMHNIGIHELVRFLYNADGSTSLDVTASNNKIASNYFRQLNTQRNNYSLGNGITFPNEAIKGRLGKGFDTVLKRAGYYSLIHGLCLCYWNLDRMIPLPIADPKRNGGTVPLWDETTGNLGAAVRFWQLAPDKPIFMTLFEQDGLSKYRCDPLSGIVTESESKRGYVQRTSYIPVNNQTVVVGEENYSSLPIVPLWGSELHQSTLLGMRAAIDAYDMVFSGFANDLNDCAQIYWILNNCDAMSDEDMGKFRKDLLFRHIANIDSDAANITPYTQEIPTNARTAFLQECRSHIYEAFGGLDVHTVAAGATNDHIDAAYQPLDDNADDYEFQIIECVQQLLALQGVENDEATPQFKRNRISNTKEQTETVLLAANYLDDETVLKKLPFISPDEIAEILERKDEDEMSKTTTFIANMQENHGEDNQLDGEDE